MNKLEELSKKLQHLLDVTIVGNVGICFNREFAKEIIEEIKELDKSNKE